MEKRVRSFIFLVAILSVHSFAFGQFTSAHPPEPMMATSQKVPGSDCVKDTNGSGPSVPVGLCLPINDYLFPLFISGVALGAYSLFYFQQEKEAKNSVV